MVITFRNKSYKIVNSNEGKTRPTIHSDELGAGGSGGRYVGTYTDAKGDEVRVLAKKGESDSDAMKRVKTKHP